MPHLALVLIEQPRWLNEHRDVLVVKPLRILLILLAALIIRGLVSRSIRRVTRVGNGGTPRLLKPLRERALPVLEHTALLSERRRQRAETVGSILRSITSFAVLGLAFVLILGELGINLAPIIAGAGIVGVALGFGAQNLVKDFLSGIFMVLEDQYGVGDVVDVGPASGKVEAVGLRVTTVRDVNGTVWYVRNGEILRVGNSSQGFAVAVVDFPLAFGADTDKAIEILGTVADEVATTEPSSEDVLEPPEVLGVEKVTTDGITLRATVKV